MFAIQMLKKSYHKWNFESCLMIRQCMILKECCFSLKTVFTDILKTRIFKWYYLCLQIYIKVRNKDMFAIQMLKKSEINFWLKYYSSSTM
jgi:hypothetical protein